MAEVVTLVTGIIPPERIQEVIGPYEDALKNGPPPTLEETFLLKAEDRLAILSVWHRRSDLDALLASGEEPFARRLIRGAGGTPDVTIYEVVSRATSGAAEAAD